LSSLSACHGILDELYDKPSDNVTLKEGQLYVDASSWTDWYYIDLEHVAQGFVKMEIPTKEYSALSPQPSTINSPGLYTYWYDVFGAGLSNYKFHNFTPTEPQPEPENWHIAIHRNNVRTNGGAVYETDFTSMDDLPKSSEAFAEATFTPDEWNERDVWTIRDKMLQGFIDNQGIYINNVLSSWLMVSMPPPPVFTLNNHVFIVRFDDDTHAAFQLENYQSPSGVKCCLTINYKYPY
jgi:hypothetical protein